jgi:uncharacterized damage-inducible protein DinB
MITSTIQLATLINGMEQTAASLIDQLQMVSDTHFNRKPSAKKWSIAQVADHIYLSNQSIIKALQLDGTEVDRDPAERIEELKEMFLDFSKLYKAPLFIVPQQTDYNREQLMQALLRSLQQIHRLMYKTELNVLINHPAFGDISKLEILYFVLYHTQRHLRQIKQTHTELLTEKDEPAK